MNYSKVCKDYTKIENYELAKKDNFKGWVCHHRLECVETGAVVNSSRQDLIDWNIYFNRPADELIFLTRKEHRALHTRNKTEEVKEKLYNENVRKKISNTLSGRKTKPCSEETKRKIAEAQIGKVITYGKQISNTLKEYYKTHEHPMKGKVGSERGKTWFTNGIRNTRAFECPDGFWKGFTRF